MEKTSDDQWSVNRPNGSLVIIGQRLLASFASDRDVLDPSSKLGAFPKCPEDLPTRSYGRSQIHPCTAFGPLPLVMVGMASSSALNAYLASPSSIGALSLLLIASFVVVLPQGETLPIAPTDGTQEPIGNRFGDCPTYATCDAVPGTGDYPDPVAGHTTFAFWYVEQHPMWGSASGSAPSPSGPSAPGPTTASPNAQRECVTWFDGRNLDQRPGKDDNKPGLIHYPSDETLAAEGSAMQDYSFNRDAPGCAPHSVSSGPAESSLGLPTDFAAASGFFHSTIFEATYAIAVEKEVCDPVKSRDFRFRGHLDFVDPNGVYHEVQEYDFDACPQLAGLPSLGAPPVEQVFPWNRNDTSNTQGCLRTDSLHLENEWGHKCNGTMQDPVRQRLWITRLHETVFDPTVDWIYNFALQIDTCSGINVYEADGKAARGAENDYKDAHRFPDGNATALLQTYHDLTYHRYYDHGVDDLVDGWPSADVCTDGSSFSFNANPRDRRIHSTPPPAPGDEQIMLGNSFDFDEDSHTLGNHRTNCRTNDMDWPMSTYPDQKTIGEDCYPEDHKTAQIDVYGYSDGDHPLLDEFEERSNGRTGIGSA